MNEEYSEGGSRILRHKERVYDKLEPAFGHDENIENIEKHIESNLGSVETVFHELVSDIVHIDVHYVAPTPKRDYYTLVTSGMSDLPMATPSDYHDFRFGELYFNLPKDWKLDDESLKDEQNYWPIRWLKQLARFPHEYASWLSYGHTIPNGDPAEPIENTKFIGVMLLSSMNEFDEFEVLEISEDKSIFFYNVVPLFAEEMNLKLKKGAEHIEDLMINRGFTGALNIDRNSVVKKWWKK